VSALTMFEIDEMLARHASYETLAEIIRRRFQNPRQDLRELFGRLTFNILCGNTDDHARNHAAFWGGKNLRLTPAYDVCPQLRTGNEAGQGMLIEGHENRSQLGLCLKSAPQFRLTDADARAIILRQVNTIRVHWDGICDEANLSAADRALLYGRQFLNPFAFHDAPEEIRTAGQF
jgi:serine/threonine-protein kinase HipA